MPTRDNRLANLRALFEWERIRIGSPDRLGPKAAAARAISERLPKEGPGKASDAYITQVVRGYRTDRDARDRTPSEALCEALEESYSLPKGWMSTPHEDALEELRDFAGARRLANLAPGLMQAHELRAEESQTTYNVPEPEAREAVSLLRRQAKRLSASDRRVVAELIASYIRDEDASEHQLDAVHRMLGGSASAPKKVRYGDDGAPGLLPPESELDEGYPPRKSTGRRKK
jgi:hypothetical protein